MLNQCVLKMKKLVVLSLFLCFSIQLFSQAKTSQKDLLKIFIDCTGWCDQEFFRQEMTFVNFMQDRQNANVFIQITDQRTGTGGREYRLRFQGQEKFAEQADTIIFYTSPDATDNVRRSSMLDEIKKALLPFLLQTELKNQIQYSIKTDESNSKTNNSLVKDPWNYWTFTIRTNSWFNGQESSRFLNLFNSFSVNRTTNEHKFNFSLNYSLNESRFKLSDNETAISKQENASGNGTYVNSINDHWSVGVRGGFRSSTYSNIDFSSAVKPTVEYNVFPYDESSQHQFAFRYGIGPVYRNYKDTTTFGLIEEWLGEQEFTIQYVNIKDWGTLSIELEFENYLHDWSQMNIGLNPELEWNIAKGLNLNLGAFISYISNLRNIQNTELSNQDIILQNRQLATNFEYFGNIGLSYRFGSSYNNIVNPRF